MESFDSHLVFGAVPKIEIQRKEQNCHGCFKKMEALKENKKN